ncbi:hypothetical protein [Halarsenatibacter silvermanii]|uniref:Outer membrane protein beta-barrel domain-containing protein n=1 Tax=Halarsenatibacter silvermanii TaxID=321763 RepID=A0A1G9LVU2_9FIRM|nr:hypothetical protein [Halarsenatibacter silvermanii]SDL66150.1 hypothetical protein SAMN04488692_10728 [Halarsenatibacter silvermanii]
MELHNMKKALLTGFAVLMLVMTLAFVSGSAEAQIPEPFDARVFFAPSYLSFADGEMGFKTGLEGRLLPGVNVIGEAGYYSYSDGSVAPLRVSAAYDLTPRLMLRDSEVSLLAGVGLYRISVDDDEFDDFDDDTTELDLHFGGKLEQAVGDRTSVRVDAMWITGVSDLDSSLEMSLGLGYNF